MLAGVQPILFSTNIGIKPQMLFPVYQIATIIMIQYVSIISLVNTFREMVDILFKLVLA